MSENTNNLQRPHKFVVTEIINNILIINIYDTEFKLDESFSTPNTYSTFYTLLKSYNIPLRIKNEPVTIIMNGKVEPSKYNCDTIAYYNISEK